MSSVGEEMPKLIERSQELLQDYIEIGGISGAMGAGMIKRDIREATEALASGDVLRILRSYETLKGHE